MFVNYNITGRSASLTITVAKAMVGDSVQGIEIEE
jgi:hypothetical protein